MKQIRFRASFWLFCIVMTFLYYSGLTHPEESNYWLAKFGLAILILEFFSVFVVIALLELTDKASYRRASRIPVSVIVVVTGSAIVSFALVGRFGRECEGRQYPMSSIPESVNLIVQAPQHDRTCVD